MVSRHCQIVVNHSLMWNMIYIIVDPIRVYSSISCIPVSYIIQRNLQVRIQYIEKLLHVEVMHQHDPISFSIHDS